MAAERDAETRYIAAFLTDRIGATFSGRISGVARFGIFVTLDDTGAEGLVPVSTLVNDKYKHDETHHLIEGRYTGQVYRLGDRVEVRLAEAEKSTGSVVFGLLEDFGSTGGTHRWRRRARVRV